MLLEIHLPCLDGYLEPVFGRGDWARPIGVVCAIWVISQIKVDEQPAVGEEFWFKIAACSIRLLTGEGILRVPLAGKDRVLQTIIDKRGPFDRSIAVGDSLVDVPLFRACDSSIAFRPMDDAARDEADVTIHGPSLEPVADHILHLLSDRSEK